MSFSRAVLVYLVALNSYCFCSKPLPPITDKRLDVSLQVNLPQGRLQGKASNTLGKNQRYYSFSGIPYAIPPINDLRFKPPVRDNRNWNGVLDATREQIPLCPQPVHVKGDTTEESEDCLYVNVFTPVPKLKDAEVNPTLPVMVWIHGGVFLKRSTDTKYFGPDYLVDEGLVTVTFGYRLGPFGFLSTEDLESPGNYALKDQHLALRWVKENIKYFGGNPNNVTLAGESTGAAFVQYQMMYAENQGLFRAAITQSGSALCTWAHQSEPKKIAFELGRVAGIKTDSSAQLMDYLRTLSTEQLQTATAKITLKHTFGMSTQPPFSPTIEPNHPEAFIKGKVHELLADGQFLRIPTIVGFNSEEAIMLQQDLEAAAPILQYFKVDPDKLIPDGMKSEASDAEVGNSITQFYFSSSSSIIDQYMTYIHDAYFVRPIIESARLFGRLAPNYLYNFTYEGKLGRKARGYDTADAYKGVSHMEEMAYVWSKSTLPKRNDPDDRTRLVMATMWANFAKYSNPTPPNRPEDILENTVWPISTGNLSHLIIKEKLTVKPVMKKKCLVFWGSLYEKYGRPPFDSY